MTVLIIICNIKPLRWPIGMDFSVFQRGDLIRLLSKPNYQICHRLWHLMQPWTKWHGESRGNRQRQLVTFSIFKRVI